MSSLPELFPGFDAQLIPTSEADIFTRIGGAGPPLLLLHGFPQTHVMWHAMAPRLAERFSLVIADLRGYGQSSCPEADPEHVAYSKRTMARDMVEVMGVLGHGRFALLAHDRGARAAYRLALDEPGRITRMALLDIVPTHTMWNGMGQALALKAYHWLFLAQPEPLPETLISGAPDYYAEHTLASWTAAMDLSAFDPKALEHYRAQFPTLERVHACCEDCRAGATCDYEADRTDREAGRKIACPTCVVWGSAGFPGETGSPLDIWREWCADVEGGAVACGHFVAEELPQDTLEAVLPFLLRS